MQIAEMKLPQIVTPLPGPKARAIVDRDQKVISPSYTRDYPLVAKTGRGALIEDADGNVFLDFAAGIAVVSTGHCHPEVVSAIQRQAADLIHMSSTDFYYEGMVELAEKLISITPGKDQTGSRLGWSIRMIGRKPGRARISRNSPGTRKSLIGNGPSSAISIVPLVSLRAKRSEGKCAGSRDRATRRTWIKGPSTRAGTGANAHSGRYFLSVSGV